MRIVVLDTEHSTGAFRPYESKFYLTCCGVVTKEGGGERSEELVWFDHKDVEATDGGIDIIQAHVDNADLLVFHNAKHDISVLHGFGVRLSDTQLHCTMIADYIIEGQNKEMGWSLNAVAERYGLEQKLDEVKSYWDRGVDTWDIPEWILGPYCLKDCHLTLDIFEKQLPRIEEGGLIEVINLQNEFIYVLSEMECNGIKFSKETAYDIIEEHQVKEAECKEQILMGVEYGDKINLSSNQQLSAFLFGGLLKTERREWTVTTYKTKPYSLYYEKKITDETQIEGMGFVPAERTKKANGYYKVDKDTIRTLAGHTVKQRNIKKLLIEYSTHAKVVSTLQGRKGDKGLLSKLQLDGCIHPNFNQAVTATGRLTSSDPNGQNLFPAIKSCFVPRHDGILQVDLSQVEWRNAAWLARDKTMMEEIQQGVDQHVATLVNLMEGKFVDKSDPTSKKNRNHAKVFNFRMLFGGTEWGFYLDVDMPRFAIKKWKKIIEAFWDKYEGLKKFHRDNIKFVFRNGYLKLPTGRWFKFNKKHLKGGDFGYAINQVKNYPIQGMSGGDILPLMAVVIRRGMRKMGLRSLLILTVHDSIVFDFIEEEREKLARLCYNVGNNLRSYIGNYYKIDWDVDLEVEVEAGENYGAMKYLPSNEVGL